MMNGWLPPIALIAVIVTAWSYYLIEVLPKL